VGILAVIEAHHQPWRAGGAPGERPVDATTDRSDRRRMEGNVEAVGTGKGGETGKVLKGSQVMVPGTADPFAPLALGQGKFGVSPGLSRR
jgi:hypothetical protein